MKEHLRKFWPDIAGLVSYSLVVSGLWAKYGWECGVIALGAPFAAFYFWGEYRATGGNPQ